MKLGKLIRQNESKRTFISEDVKHILDGIDSILHIYSSIIDSALKTHSMVMLDPSDTAKSIRDITSDNE